MSSDGTSSTDLTNLLSSIAGFTTIFEDLFALEVTAANSAVVQAENASTFAAAAATSASNASTFGANASTAATTAATQAGNAVTEAIAAQSSATAASNSATAAATSAATAQAAANSAANLNTLYQLNTTGGSVTLNATQAAAGIIWVTGNLGSNLTITMPATTHPFILDNATTGTGTVTVQMASGTASTTVGQGNANQLFCDGATGIYSVSSVSGLQFTGVNPISAATNALTNQYQGAYTPMSNSGGTTYQVTLPTGATMGVGGAVFLDAISGKWSAKPAGSDTADFGSTFAMNPNDKAMFTWNGTSWRTTLYTNQSSPVFSQSLTVPVAYITSRAILGGVTDDGTTALQATSGRFTTSLQVPTMAPGDNSTNASSTAFVTNAVSTAITNLVGGAPAALDTLNALATALNDETNFGAVTTNALATKANISGQAFTGSVTAPTIGATTSMTTQGFGGVATQGILYFGNSGANYLLWDGTNYNLPAGGLTVNGQQVWTAGNFTPSNYAAFAAAATFQGAVTGTAQVGALKATSTGTNQTSIQLLQPGAATDQKTWEFIFQANGAFKLRSTNDAYTNEYDAIVLNRNTGYTIGSMQLMSSGGEVLVGTGLINDGSTTMQVGTSFAVQRSGVGGQTINLTSAVGNTITSYSSPSNAKTLVFNSTTDSSNTAVTAGTLGLYFQILGTTAMNVVPSGNVIMGSTSSDDGVNKLQVYGSIGLYNTGSGITFPDGTKQTTGYAVTNPVINTYTPTAGTTVIATQTYGLGLVQVFEGGAYLVPGQDYTATTGNSITLTNAASGRSSYTVMTGALFNASNVIQPNVVQISGTVGSTTLTLPSSTMAGYLWLFQGAAWLSPITDFTFNGGTTVTLTAAPTQTSDTFTAIMLNPVSFANTATQTNVQAAQLTFAMDTGAVNAYAVTYIPAVGVPTNGMQLSFFVSHTNTGASTLACNGGTAYPIWGNAHQALTGGELVAAGFVELVFSTALGCWILLENTGGAQQIAGNLNFVGLGQRITGDMSNVAQSNRLFFQTSTANNNTLVSAMAAGTGVMSGYNCFGGSDPNNATLGQFATYSTEMRFTSTFGGSASYVPMTFYTGGSERMRLTAAGLLGINATAANIAGTRLVARGTVAEWPAEITNQNTNGSAGGCLLMQVQQTASQYIQFFYGATIVGSVTTNGSSTTFGTTSDYRLKSNIKPLKGASDRLLKLGVYNYHFTADPEQKVRDGFLSHEVAEVVEEAVVGEKDAVEYYPVLREGHDPSDIKPHDVHEVGEMIIPQLVDYSKVVPLLTAALQEAIREIRVLKIQVAELKKQKP